MKMGAASRLVLEKLGFELREQYGRMPPPSERLRDMIDRFSERLPEADQHRGGEQHGRH